MSSIFPEESLHSYIYRVHRVHGISDLSNIITNQGTWSPKPEIKKGTLQNYEPINEEALLTLLREFGLAKHNEHPLLPTINYLSELDTFLNGSTRKVSNRVRRKFKIKYCLQCIYVDIKKYGVGSIKKSWMTKEYYCHTHKVNLHQAIVSSIKEATVALSNIYSGRPPQHFQIVEPDKFCIYPLDQELPLKKFDYTAPCFFELWMEYIRTNRFSFEIVGHGYSINKDWAIRKLYLTLNKIKHPSFIKFLDDNCTLVEVNVGIKRKPNLKEKIWKSKNTSCNNCILTMCSINQTIIPPRHNERFTSISTLTLKGLLYHLGVELNIIPFSERIDVIRQLRTVDKLSLGSRAFNKNDQYHRSREFLEIEEDRLRSSIKSSSSKSVPSWYFTLKS